MAETVLVTGANGFVGTWCIAELLQQGFQVRATLRDLGKVDVVRRAIECVTPIDGRLQLIAADLMQNEGWAEAVSGVSAVLHVASPMMPSAGGDLETFVRPATEGTLRVLRAACSAGVSRVVMTSSTAACVPPADTNIKSADESFWTPVQDVENQPYRKSKLLAEQAAWDFLKTQTGSTTLTTILPTAIFGPALMEQHSGGSVGVIKRIMTGRPPLLPRIGFNIVDVRDLAALHVRAIGSEAAIGKRFIANGGFLWMTQIAAALREGLGQSAPRVRKYGMPNWAFHVIARFAKPLRSLAPLLGRDLVFSADRARKELGFLPREVKQTVVDCAKSILDQQSIVPKVQIGR